MSESNNDVGELFRTVFKRIVNELVDKTIVAFKNEDVAEIGDWRRYFESFREWFEDPYNIIFQPDWPELECVRLARIFESFDAIVELQQPWASSNVDDNWSTVSSHLMWVIMKTLVVGVQAELRERGIWSNRVDEYLQWRASNSNSMERREMVWSEFVVGRKPLPDDPANTRVT